MIRQALSDALHCLKMKRGYYEQEFYQKNFDAARMHRDDRIVRHERISCGLQNDDRKD
jgi:hypothetical protein